MKGWILAHHSRLLTGVPVLFLILLILYIFSGRCISACNEYVQAAKVAVYTSHVKL